MANVTAMYRYLAELGANLNKMEDELFWHMTQLDSDEGIRSPFRESDEEYQRSFLRLRQSLQRSRSERARVRTLQEKERTAEDKCHEIVEKIWAFDERRLLRWLQEEEEAERHNLKVTLEEGETFRRELNGKARRLAGHPSEAPREARPAGGVRTPTHRLQPQRNAMRHALVPRSSRRCSQLVVHDPAPGSLAAGFLRP